MKFISTRGQTPPLGFSDAVATGLAPDGGLFLPETLPDFSGDLSRFAGLGYAELCFEFLRVFATDIPAATLRSIVEKSYTAFSHPDIAPLRRLGPSLHVLELFHGPTLAFKDFALQLLGNLYEHQCAVRREAINVLGATSGDTGAAAIHGLLGKPGTAIFILYPDGRVSPLQERQMTCTGADNVYALAVDGSFDDAQTALKELFGDLLGRFEGEIGAADHQKRDDQDEIEAVLQPDQQQGGREQEQQFVLQRPCGNLADDRQLALRCQADHVARRDRRIVDDDAGRLGAGFAGRARDIVER